MLRPSLFPVFGRRRSRSAGFLGFPRSRFEIDPEVWALMIDNPLSRFPGIKVKNSMSCFLYCWFSFRGGWRPIFTMLIREMVLRTLCLLLLLLLLLLLWSSYNRESRWSQSRPCYFSSGISLFLKLPLPTPKSLIFVSKFNVIRFCFLDSKSINLLKPMHLTF